MEKATVKTFCKPWSDTTHVNPDKVLNNKSKGLTVDIPVKPKTKSLYNNK